MCKFKPMTLVDAHAVYVLEQDLFSDPWPRDSFFSEPIENEKAFAFVSEKKNEIVGYIMGWYIEKEIHISNVAVMKKHQRQGIGSFLVSNLLKYYDHFEICFLEVRESNYSAQKLYNKFGFKDIFTRKSYYSNGENAVVMSKQK